MANDPKTKHLDIFGRPIGIPEDVEMPPGLGPGARALFRAMKSLAKRGDPDRMMRDLHDGKHDDG